MASPQIVTLQEFGPIHMHDEYSAAQELTVAHQEQKPAQFFTGEEETRDAGMPSRDKRVLAAHPSDGKCHFITKEMTYVTPPKLLHPPLTTRDGVTP